MCATATRLSPERDGVIARGMGQARGGALVSIKDGGSLVTYDNEDSDIQRRFRAELAQLGIEYQMDRF